MENWTHDFNIGSMVRTANAFQARRVHIVGPHKWNRKGALMTELYQHVENHPSITELVECWRLRIAGEIAAARSQAAAIAFHMRESAGGVGGVDDAHGVDGVLGVGGADDVQGVGGVGSAYGIGGADGAVGANGIGGVGGTDGVNGADGIQRAGAAGGIGGGVDGTQGTSVAGVADGVENASGTAGRKAVQLARLAELDAKIAELEAARVIALDIVPGAVPMETYRFPKRCLMLFGAEGPGLSKKALELADDVVYISQFGSVRSINAGAAAAVSMHAWIAQHAVPQV
nr:TrmH family RNA methyltransferase [Bifidobacterium sp. UBA6881]